MSAHEVETLIAAGLIAAAGYSTLYALPSWITRRCSR